MPAPSYLQIEPSAICNLRCPMCAINYRHVRGQLLMKYDLFQRIIDGCPGIRRLHLQGVGEPLLHPGFFDMVSYAAAKGITVTTNTNLLLLTGATALRCVASGLAAIYVSVDGATPDVYESIRAGARFEQLMRCLELLNRARKAGRGVLPRLRIVTVAMQRNLHELPGIVRLAGRMGAEGVYVQHLCLERPSARQNGQQERFFVRETLMSENVRRVERYFHGARTAAAAAGVELHLPKMRPRVDGAGDPVAADCDWPMRGAYIDYRGEIMPCCMSPTAKRMSLGNIRCHSVREAWMSAGYRRFCQRLAAKRPPAVCRKCSIYRGIF